LTERASRPLEDFLAEATESVDALSRELLVLDRAGGDADPERVNALFRAAHSLKGLAAMFGVVDVAELAHAMEDVLDAIRLGKVAPSRTVIDALLDGLDVVGARLRALSAADGGEVRAEPERIAAVKHALAAALERRAAVSSGDPLDALGLPPSVRQVLTEYEEHRLRENVLRGRGLAKVRAAFALADFDVRLSALAQALKEGGEVVSTLPSSEPDPAGIAFDLIVATDADDEALAARAKLHGATVSRLGAPPPEPKARGKKRRAKVAPAEVQAPQPVRREEPRPPPPERSRAEDEGSLRSLGHTVRVDIAKLDRLMNVVGELVLVRTNLQRLSEALLRAGTDRAIGAELLREQRQFERRLDELQDGLLEVRMVPLEQIFDKLARLVRKLARDAGKEIELAVAGGDVELDKLIVEELSDPLMHLIRNSIDHGIEAPDVRQAQGKSRRGTLRLTAAQRGNHVLIEVSDDGAGIDEARVREVAAARGLLPRSKLDELPRRDLLGLLFEPGFSTAREVSALSGRGVGLDVVKTNIANLSGLIDVRSEPGQGTSFAVTLPITLAIVRALLVGVAGRTFALPLASVLEIVSIDPAEVATLERREVITLRGATLRLVRLARHFELSEAAVPVRRKLYVVVVGIAAERVGLAVDVLVGQQDVVVKPLGAMLDPVRGIAGATDLGNRRTVLVLDVGAIVEEVLQRRAIAEAS
jgi:two-component system chemotaxis sensor kinase CheA